MTKLNQLFEAYVEKNYGGVVTTAAIEAAYEIFLGLPGDFLQKDQRIAYWEAKNISAENFAEQFLKEAEELNADNAKAFGVTQDNRKAVVNVAREAADNGDIDVIRQQVKAEVDSQPGEGEQPGVPGETFSLTSDADTIRPETDADLVQETDEEGNPVGEPELVAPEGVQFATENNDIIEGLISTRSSSTIFNREDFIDGGEGFDTLRVTMQNDFGGFRNEGGMQNVERVELTLDSNRDRTFSADEIEGVEVYALHGTADNGVRLTNLADANITVELNNQGDSNLQLGFTTTATSVTSTDQLNLVLNNVGTAQVGTQGLVNGSMVSCPNFEPAKTVNLQTTNGQRIDVVNINSMGERNWFNLDGNVGRETVEVTGSGAIHLSNFASTLSTFDASESTGDVTANFSGSLTARTLSKLTGGEGDNSFTANASSFATTASIDGGEGNNQLTIVNAASNTLRPEMENIQTLNAQGTGALTLAAGDVEGLELVTYGMNTTSSTFMLAGLGNDELTIQLQAGSFGLMTYTGEGEVTIQTEAGNGNPTHPCTGALLDSIVNTINSNVTITRAESVVVNVSAYSEYALGSSITAGLAEEVTLNVASGLANVPYAKTNGVNAGDELTAFSGTLNANNAEVVNLNADGILGGIVNANKAEELNLNVTAHGQALDLRAGEAMDLTLSVSGNDSFTLAETSQIGRVETLTVMTGSDVEITTAMNGLADATISGTGSFILARTGSFQAAVPAQAGGTPAKSSLQFTFTGLADGQSITFAGLTLTASGAAMTAADVAAALVAGTGTTGTLVAGYAINASATPDNMVTLATTADVLKSEAEIIADADISVTGTTQPSASNHVAGTDGAPTPLVPADATFTEADGTTAIDAGRDVQDVTIDASDLLGNFAITIRGYDDSGFKNGSAVVEGSEVGTNVIQVLDRNDIEITGGVQADTIVVRGKVENTADQVATAVLTGGLGADTFDITTGTGVSFFVEITDFEVGVGGDKFANFTVSTTTVTESAAADALADIANIASVVTENIRHVDLNVDGTAAVKGFAYNNEVYLLNGDILVQLSGLSEGSDYVLGTAFA